LFQIVQVFCRRQMVSQKNELFIYAKTNTKTISHCIVDVLIPILQQEQEEGAERSDFRPARCFLLITYCWTILLFPFFHVRVAECFFYCVFGKVFFRLNFFRLIMIPEWERRAHESSVSLSGAVCSLSHLPQLANRGTRVSWPVRCRVALVYVSRMANFGSAGASLRLIAHGRH
ncbi:hypothetical protein RvY_02915, partial [Ramazzottius varieornatus]